MRFRPDKHPGRSRDQQSCLDESQTNLATRKDTQPICWASCRLHSTIPSRFPAFVRCHSCWDGLWWYHYLWVIPFLVNNPSPTVCNPGKTHCSTKSDVGVICILACYCTSGSLSEKSWSLILSPQEQCLTAQGIKVLWDTEGFHRDNGWDPLGWGEALLSRGPTISLFLSWTSFTGLSHGAVSAFSFQSCPHESGICNMLHS